jgi:hypothetical protein
MNQVAKRINLESLSGYQLGPTLIQMEAPIVALIALSTLRRFYFRVNEFSNVVFSKFIAQQKMNKIAKDHIRKFVDPEKLFLL